MYQKEKSLSSNFDEKLFYVALSLIPNIGPVLSKKLIQYCGSAEAIFRERKQVLLRIPGIGVSTTNAITTSGIFQRAETEMLFAEKNEIQILTIKDASYPRRLSHCYDAPVVLYKIGNANVNPHRVVAVVGTRAPSPYGTMLCEKLISELAPYEVLIMSGLAHGIDSVAHRGSVKNNLPTIGVLGHGLDTIYPYGNRNLAAQLVNNGALLTEYTSGTKPDRENFPSRNRIVAGMADAIVVIESAKEGGSLITSEYAVNYNRDVFAFPGRINDPRSEGCNRLIQNNKAALIQSGDDLARMMGWNVPTEAKPARRSPIIIPLDSEEEHVLLSMRNLGNAYIDEISSVSGYPMTKVSSLLMNLEASGMVKSLPGMQFRLDIAC